MFEPKIRNRQTDLLIRAVLQLHDEEDAYRFFEDLCTIPEIKSISQRLEVAELLRKKLRLLLRLFFSWLRNSIQIRPERATFALA